MQKALLTLLLFCNIAHSATPAEKLALLGYDIPEEQYSNVVAAETKTLQKIKQQRDWKSSETDDWKNAETNKNAAPTELARKHYPQIELPWKELCKSSTPADIASCLESTRKNPEHYRALLQPYNKVFQDIAQLEKAEPQALQNVFPDELLMADTPIPNYRSLLMGMLTRNALLLATEDKDALPAICRQITFGKNLILSQDSLMQSLVGARIVTIQLDLLALANNKLADSKGALPPDCQQALQPLSAEQISVCPLGKRERNWTKNEITAISEKPHLYQHQPSIAYLDETFERYCQQSWQTAVAEDASAQALPKLKLDEKFCNNNSEGCGILATIDPDLASYQNRLQDSNAYLRLWHQVQENGCEIPNNAWAASRELKSDKQTFSIRAYAVGDRKSYQVHCAH